MSEWNELPLERLADISSGGTPSRANPIFWGGDIPWVTPSDITVCKTNYLFDAGDSITQAGLSSSSAKLLPQGTLLLTSRASIGDIRIAARPLATNQGFKNIQANPLVDGGFLFYQLSRLKGSFLRYAAGSTFLEINRKDTGRVPIPHPRRKREQQKIANILQTIDQSIEKTEALIDKYQQIKSGLMHDLFTRGIGPDGQLRPPREQAPELYQETAIGWIPREWNYCSIAEASLGKLINGVFKEPSRVGEGVPLVNVADLYRGDSIRLPECELFAATGEEISRYSALAGDIFFTRSSLNLEGIAQANFLDNDSEEAVFECHVMRLRPDPKKIIPKILKEWCLSGYARKHFMAQAKQVTMTTISQDGVFGLLCPILSLGEQEKIATTINSVEHRLSAERQLFEKLRKQKAGLMHKLLTGKIQVKVETEVEPEIANV